MTERAELLRVMRLIREGKMYDSKAALCYNIEMMLDCRAVPQAGYYWNTVREQLFRAWPKRSGCLAYPVPCPESSKYYGIGRYAARIYHKCNGEFFEGDYGELRMELLSNMIWNLENGII
jgi:hypothetical protein